MLISSIPSPSTGVVNVWFLHLHLYGLTLLVAIVACIWLTGRRWIALGGDWDLVMRIAVWGVGFGVVGARLYHDVTSWDEVPTPKWQGIFEVWKGGLGIWGGILLGTLAGAVILRRGGYSVRLFMDAAAPGLLLAQGIGRIGNWWNQELFGRPTSLPWGLRIDDSHTLGLALKYQDRGTYQPTFLYELIWDLLGVALLIWVGHRRTIRPPALFALYVAYYTFGRFFEELLRIDPSHHLAGLRLNAWVSIVVFAGALFFFYRIQFRGGGGDTPAPPHRATPAGPRMAIPKGRVR